MKTLFLMRHAKSSWENRDLSDFERPLNERGERDAPQMGKVIGGKKFPIELIISSPAERAKQTARLVKEAAQIGGEIIFDDKIYEASPHALLRIVSEIDDARSAVMLIGHNPGFENLIKFLTGEIAPMPTAALAVIKLNVERWSEIRERCGSLQTKITPKDEAQIFGTV